MEAKKLIDELQTRWLERDEIDHLNLIFHSEEQSIVKAFDTQIKNLDQDKFEFIFLNSKSRFLDPELSYFIKQYVVDCIINLYLNNQDNNNLFEKNFFEYKEIHNNLYYIIIKYDEEKIISVYDALALKLNLNFSKEIFELCNRCIGGNYTKITNILNYLPNRDLTAIWEYALEKDRISLHNILDAILVQRHDWQVEINSSINDESDLCKKIIYNNITFPDYVIFSKLGEIILNKLDKNKSTVNALLNLSIQNKNIDCINKLSEVVPYKIILKKLYQFNEQNLIKKFVDKNKDNYQIKDLVVYY